MQASDPVWYEALKGNPLQAPTFTDVLKTRIRDEALSVTVGRNPRLHRYMLIGICTMSLLGFILFATNPSTPTPSNTNFSQEQPGLSITDSIWQESIDSRHLESLNEILYTQQLSDDSMLIFFKRLYEHKGYHSISLTADLFVRKTQQWEWKGSTSMSIGDPQRETHKEMLLTLNSGFEQVSIFYGVIIDKSVVQVEVVDRQNVMQVAQMFRHSDGNTYWFIAIPHDETGYKDGYTVTGLDLGGNVQTSKTYYTF